MNKSIESLKILQMKVQKKGQLLTFCGIFVDAFVFSCFQQGLPEFTVSGNV